MNYPPFSKSFKRYLLIGISVFVFEIAVILISQQLGANDVTAVGLSFWLGLIVSFVLQKFVTFDDRRTHHRILIPQMLAFTVLVMWNFVFTIGLTKLSSDLIPATLCRTIALALTTIWNFYLYKTRIFKGLG